MHGVRDPAKTDLNPQEFTKRKKDLSRFHISHSEQGLPTYYDVNTD